MLLTLFYRLFKESSMAFNVILWLGILYMNFSYPLTKLTSSPGPSIHPLKSFSPRHFPPRDSLQHNLRLELIGKVPKFLIMPTIPVGFSLGAATNPPPIWFRSVSLPSIAKQSFKYAKLVERIESYIPPHHTGHKVGDMSGTKYTIQSVGVIWQRVKPIMGGSNNTPLTGLYDSCVLEHLELVEQRGWRDCLLWFITRISRLKTGFFSWNTKVFGGPI